MIATCADLCNRSYDDTAAGFVDVGDLRYGVFPSPHGTIICIRGTANAENWLRDARAWPTRSCGGYLAHKGFVRAYQALCAGGMPTVKDSTVIATGHSLGGAIATLLGEHIGCKVVSFGSPKVYLRFFPAPKLDHTRVVHDADVVPKLPAICYDHKCAPLYLKDHDLDVVSITDHFMYRYIKALNDTPQVRTA